LIQVYNGNGDVVDQVRLPQVFLTPIRSDIVQFVHTNMRKNSRQPYAVASWAGHQTSAESWGTGRAVARIPRVPGGGTHRAGQGAFGNMCRGGRMFSPLRTYRKWHRKIVLGHKRYAVASALAASAVPALVMARGHKISQIPEIPLVIANEAFEGITKTKKAAALLKTLSVGDDIQKAKYSVVHRAGLGKMRNRPYKEKLGPILVHSVNGTFGTALRNLPGLEIVHVDRLSLLRLAPGGHLGRFIIWTRGAFERLDTIWGTRGGKSRTKKGYRLPRPILTNPDITRIITSDEIRSAIRPIRNIAKHKHWVNPFRNPRRMAELNPFFSIQTGQRRKAAIANRAKRVKALTEKREKWNAAKNEEFVKERREADKKARAEKKAAAEKAAGDVKEAVTKGLTTVSKKLSQAFKKLLRA